MVGGQCQCRTGSFGNIREMIRMSVQEHELIVARRGGYAIQTMRRKGSSLNLFPCFLRKTYPPLGLPESFHHLAKSVTVQSQGRLGWVYR